MKKIILAFAVSFLCVFSLPAREYTVHGPQGGKFFNARRDSIVPLWCSERYKETYGDRAELTVIEGENHLINRRRDHVVARTVSFFRSVFPFKTTMPGF